jgi:hypothetical protein
MVLAGQVTSSPELPYIAKCNKGWQAAAMLGWLVLVISFFILRTNDGRLAIFQVWHQSGLMKLGIIFGLVCVPILPFEVFRAATVFDTSSIKHRSAISRWREYRYEDISGLEVFAHEFVRISFRNGETLKVWAMRADLQVVEQIVRPWLKQ